MSIVAVDVAYDDAEGGATVAVGVFDSWAASTFIEEYVTRVSSVEPYVPGEFYRRELPCILAGLALVPTPVDTVVVDGYVWLPACISHSSPSTLDSHNVGDTSNIGSTSNIWSASGASASSRKIDNSHETGWAVRPGIGMHVHSSLGIEVIGVAKSRFASAPLLWAVYRGSSHTPLWVTATHDETSARQKVRSMHGANRLPTLLRRVDALSRGRVPPIRSTGPCSTTL